MKPAASFLRVSYDLRPAKQVERRMLIETFQALSHLGFPISSCQYTGMGSVFFVDFILVHKILGINALLSVEVNKSARKRVKFNQPFRCVNVKYGEIGDYIPTLSRRKNHILWLDYDSVVRSSQLADLWVAAAHLPRRSIVLVTVDVEPPTAGGPRKWRDHFQAEAASYLGTKNKVKDFHESKLVDRSKDVLHAAINSGLAHRDIRYLPLFSFSYADGHEMLTIGGMLGNDEDEALINGSRVLNDLKYLRKRESDLPFRISVPPLTRKERLYLDKLMPARPGWHLKEFELPPEYISAYKEIYRYLPTYGELVF